MPRPDGRTNDELRPVEMITGYQPHAEGSVLIKNGDTWVLCAASVEDSVPSFLAGKGVGWVTAEYAMLPRSTHSRTRRNCLYGSRSYGTNNASMCLRIRRFTGLCGKAGIYRFNSKIWRSYP